MVSDVTEFLGAVTRNGVRLWVERGQLRYEAPKGAITSEDLQRLRAYRNEIISLLGDTGRCRSGMTREAAAVSFSQLAHWRQYRLHERPAVRQIAAALRIRGPLQHETLRQSLEALAQRHPALRTRIVCADGMPSQRIDRSPRIDLDLDDLCFVPLERQAAAIQQRIDEHILQPIDVAQGPLFGTRLLRLAQEDHVLVLALEHMIADGYSLGLILNDLSALYGGLLRGEPIQLPDIEVQFADYADQQRLDHQSWLQVHGDYWAKRLARDERLRFPADVAPGLHRGWDVVPVYVPPALTARLREWARLNETTPVMAMFTAYLALVMQWCETTETVVQYQSDGRGDPRTDATVGYFSFPLYVRAELGADDTCTDLLKRVTDEYCSAFEHADSSYLAAQSARPEFTHNTAFNWLPQIGEPGGPRTFGGLACSTLRFTNPLVRRLDLDQEPAIVLRDYGAEGVRGHIWFAKSRLSAASMKCLGANLVAYVDALLQSPRKRLRYIHQHV